MAKGKGPKKGAGKKKKSSGGFLTKLFLFLLILFAAFVLAGFFSPGGKTLLRRGDEAMGLKLLQPTHDSMVQKAKNGWAWLSSSESTDNTKKVEQKAPIKIKPKSPLKPDLTPTRLVPPGKFGDASKKKEDDEAKVVTEKRSNGQVIKKLDTLQKPLGEPSKKDEAELDAIIKKKTQK